MVCEGPSISTMISGIFPGTGAVKAAVDTISHKEALGAQDAEGNKKTWGWGVDWCERPREGR